jgi:hypothetical protein
MYNERLVETLCRNIQVERVPAKASQLMCFLEAVVKEDDAEICRHLSWIIEQESRAGCCDPKSTN